MIFKTNLHLHTADDWRDRLKYSTREAIDKAAAAGINVLSLTCHSRLVFKDEDREYAKQKGILLIPGIEARISRKDVVIINCGSDIQGVNTFEELRNYKKEHPEILVIAPHPFVPSSKSLKNQLIRHIDIFDAIELSIYSNKLFDFNKKAASVANKYGKPLVANSDAHRLKDIRRAFTSVKAQEKTAISILAAIKNGGTSTHLDSLNIFEMAVFRTISFYRLFRFVLLKLLRK